jgi:uncharacterized membrane protein
MTKLIRTTVTGAVVFLLPIGILAFFVGKILAAAEKMVEPISAHLPVKSVAGVSGAILVSIFGIIALSFIAGLFAQSRAARGAVEKIETHFLGRLPVYGLLKSLSNEVVAPGETSDHPVVLVRFDDAWQVGVLMGPAAEGTHSVVFLMDSPTPQSGTVMIVEADRVRTTDIPLTKAFAALSSRGYGLGELVSLTPQLHHGRA